MRFLSYFFMLGCTVSLLNLGAHEPHNRPNDPAWLAQLKKPWAVATYSFNPFATFEPSIISKGHAQYFERVNELDYEQKKDLKKFVVQLKMIKGGIACVIVFAPRLGGVKNEFAILLFASFGLVNAWYYYKLHQFEKKLDDSINS